MALNIYNKEGLHFSKNSLNNTNDIYFDTVSINLWSTYTFFIIGDNEINDINIKLYNDSNNTFQFYNINSGELELIETKNYNITLNEPLDGKYVYKVNIGFKSDKRLNASCKLNIKSLSNNIDSNFNLYCDTIVEEMRYNVKLQNDGVVLDERFIKAFKETNLGESNLDYKILNEKRFRYLLTRFQQKAFLGSYYGLTNSLKFFGYDDDVIIKEVWRYINDEIDGISKVDYKAVDIETTENPENGYERTNMLHLVYKLNDYTGELNSETGIPLLINNFRNKDDAIIKMNNLRILLELYFMPAKTKIVDIIGEETILSNMGTNSILHDALIWYHNEEFEVYNNFKVESIIKNRDVVTNINYESGVDLYKLGFGANRKDDVAIFEYSLANIGSLYGKLQHLKYELIDLTSITSPIVVYKTQTDLLGLQRTQFIEQCRYLSMAIRKPTKYKFVATYIDMNNKSIVVHYDFETKLSDLQFKYYNTIAHQENRPLKESEIYDEFKDGDFVKPIQPPTTVNTNQTYAEFLLELKNKNNITNSEKSVNFNTLFDDVYLGDNSENYIKGIDSINNLQIKYDSLKISDLIHSDYIDFRLDKLSNYGCSYTVIDVNIIGDVNVSGDRTFKISLSPDMSSISANVEEFTAEWDATVYNNSNSDDKLIYMKRFLNRFKDFFRTNEGLVSDYFLIGSKRNIDGSTLELVLTSKEFSANNIFNIELNGSTNQTVFKNNAVALVDINATNTVTVSDNSASPLIINIYNDDGTLKTNYTDNNVGSLDNESDMIIELNNFNIPDFNAYSVGGVLLIDSKHNFDLEHISLGNTKIKGLKKISTVPKLKQINRGEDIRQLSHVFIEIDNDNTVLKPQNIVWKLYKQNSGGDILIDTQENSVFSKILLDEGVYKMVVNYEDRFNNPYSKTLDSLFLVRHYINSIN